MNTSKSVPARLLFFILLFGSLRCISAQHDSGSSIPENTAADPSLPVTMQFIQNKLNEWTKFRYSVSVSDPEILRDRSIAYDTISISPDQCGLKFSKHIQSYLSAGNSWQVSNLPDTKYEFSVKDINELQFAMISKGTLLEGAPLAWPLEIPSLHVGFGPGATLSIAGKSQIPLQSLDLVFPVDQLADRFAKAVAHAVLLCRGSAVAYEDLAAVTKRKQLDYIVASQKQASDLIAQQQAQKQAQLDREAEEYVRRSNASGGGSTNTENGSDIQQSISSLRSDINSQEQSAEDDENNANQLLHNCSGPGAALCQALGAAGAAKFRQRAAQARNQADSDREEIARLQGEEGQERQRRDTSYGGSLQQVATQNGMSIQNASAQQQANLQATAASMQQRQQAEAQVRESAHGPQPVQSGTSAATSRSSSVSTAGTTPMNTVASVSTPAGSGYNPYSSAPAQGASNPYSGTGSGSTTASCTEMTGSVQGTVKVGSDGWVIGYLTNSSTETLYVSYTFKENGIPSKDMANAGGTTIRAGQTVGGELQGLYSTAADKNSPQIYWYAVLQSDHDKYGCAHKW